ATKYGFVRGDGSADTGAWIEAVMADAKTSPDLYIQDAVWPSVALRKLVDGELTLTTEELQRGFASSFGPRVEVLACVLSDQRTAQKVWEMARDNPTDRFFGELAENYSIEPVSSSNSGKVPPIRKYGGQPAIEKEAFAMKPGELSGIIATGDKYILLRCQGFTEPIVDDISVVEQELRRDLMDKKLRLAMATKFDEIREQADIDNFLEVASKMPRVAQQSSTSNR
ncbi:MAG: peptidylprolyl isomerase, partial [Planctomycetota bacterium]